MPEGESLEAGARAAGFEPFECKAGDLILIHGAVDHLSLPNHSANPRHTFQLHMIEGPSEGIKWSETNWLQLKQTEGNETKEFPRLAL